MIYICAMQEASDGRPMPGFTSTEWIVGVAPDSPGDVLVPTYLTAVFAPLVNDAIPIAVFLFDPEFRPEPVAAANAAMAAASPNMYAALKAFLAGNNRARELAEAAVLKAETIVTQTSATPVEG